MDSFGRGSCRVRVPLGYGVYVVRHLRVCELLPTVIVSEINIFPYKLKPKMSGLKSL